MGEMVAYRSNGGSGEGYLAVPDQGTEAPAVILVQEHWGLVDHIVSLADRFADAGFVALALDLFHGVRGGGVEPGGLQDCGADDARQVLMGLAMDQAAREVAGA